jgi:hypothetical protein
MMPQTATENLPAPPDPYRALTNANCLAQAGIIGALLDALNAAGGYRLVYRDGEFFLEPVCESFQTAVR